MRPEQALEAIEEIHVHLAKGEMFLGYRPFSLALTGVIAIGAWMLEPVLSSPGPVTFVYYWVTVAVVCGVICLADIIRYSVREGALTRRRAAIVVRQFVPCLAGGVILTWAFLYLGGEWVRSLPGLWAILFSCGCFASLYYLPAETTAVAFFYLLMGGLLLWRTPAGPEPWGMGITFGLGHLGLAAIQWRFERKSSLERS